MEKANWELYFGNNHIEIYPPNIYIGGSVSFKNHLGKPLTQSLWEDLIHKFTINGLCIYRPFDEVWKFEWMNGHCRIYLSANDVVEDIEITPYKNYPE